MGMAEEEEPEKKRRNVNSLPSLIPNSPTAMNKSVDASVLQYQNQKLVQQLDTQKNEMHLLREKFKELNNKQTSYDNTLIIINTIWNQLVDDLVLLGFRAGDSDNGLKALDKLDHSRGSIISCSFGETFLCRLLQAGPTERTSANGTIKYVQGALALRHSSTLGLMKCLKEVIDAKKAKTESLAMTVTGNISMEDTLVYLLKIDDLLRKEANNLQKAIEVLHLKHQNYTNEIKTCLDSHSTEQSEIRRLASELDESMAELEESRRKMINLKMQREAAAGLHTPLSPAVNGRCSPETPTERSVGMKDLKELKGSIEEAKALAVSRLSELQDLQEDNQVLSQELLDLQNKLKDEKQIVSSKPYALLNDQLQHVNTELQHCKGLIESLQADRNYIIRKEKELSIKADSADAAKNSVNNSELKIQELRHQLKKCLNQNNEIKMKLEEYEQDRGKEDIKEEFQVMASALSKEMEMMEAQLKRSKETAHEAYSLREEARCLKDQLNRKVNERQILLDRCADQMAEIKSLKDQVEKQQKEKNELQYFLDMCGQECYDNRDVIEIRESERRAKLQAEMLKTELEEHSLELRVKAAKEAEAFCQQRLSVAEAEIVDLRRNLDILERDILELTEAIRIKDAEGETYISEIETIGQAYEDIQTQNQRLLMQVAERDDYNIKLVSESVKTKQAYHNLLSEKQAIGNQLQQLNASLDFIKLKIARGEEQMKAHVFQYGKVSTEKRRLILEEEKTKLELSETERELKWFRAAVKSSEEEFEQNQQNIAATRVKLDKERSERRKLEEELAELRMTVAKMESESGEAAIQKLQDEIKNCKAILKCGVCFDRPKEVIITKCYHLFCNQCIQRNLEIRHRKCPGCGTAFGQSDVRMVKI